MDTTVKAVLCIALVAALADAIKRTWPDVWERFHIWLVFVLGVGVVFLVSETVWGKTELVMNKPLSDMNVAEKIVAGLLIAAGSSLAIKTLNRVADIGTERAKRPTHKANVVGRPVAGTGLSHGRTADVPEVGFPAGYQLPKDSTA